MLSIEKNVSAFVKPVSASASLRRSSKLGNLERGVCLRTLGHRMPHSGSEKHIGIDSSKGSDGKTSGTKGNGAKGKDYGEGKNAIARWILQSLLDKVAQRDGLRNGIEREVQRRLCGHMQEH